MSGTTRLIVLAPGGDDDLAGERLAQLLDTGDVDVEAVLWDGGPQADALRQRIPTGVVAELSSRSAGAVVEKVLHRLGRRQAGHGVRRRRLGLTPAARRDVDGVLLTSPRAAPMLRYLATPAPAPVTTLVPAGEMCDANREPLNDQDRALLLERTDRFLVEAEAGEERLITLGVPRERVVRIGETHHEQRPPAPTADRLAQLRGQLGIAPDTAVVVGSGTLVWDGGTDMFVRTGWILRERFGQEVALCWVGSGGDELERNQLDHDIVHMGLADHVHLCTDQDVLDLGDLHLLVSRIEDEPEAYGPAASRGQAIVGFHTRALDRFVGDDAGVLVDFLDLAGAAGAAAELLADVDRREALGAAAAKRFGQWHVAAERGAFLVDLLREAP